MKIQLSENLRKEFPNIKIGILEVRNIVNKRSDSRLEEKKKET